ncbi:MAG TPA: cell envelope integrity protein TolA [Gammaproteobacteria bacterium]|nr:cell envelope integrity protein TolA [Gammaproteobacteria bacterium]
MWKFLSQYGLFLILSVILHAVVIGALLVGFVSKPQPLRQYGKKENVIQAVTVDRSRIQAELNKIRRAEKRKKQQEIARKKRARKERIKQQNKLAALKKQQKQVQKKLRQQKQAQIRRLRVLKKRQQQQKANIKKLKTAEAAIQRKKDDAQKKLKAIQVKQAAEAARRKQQVLKEAQDKKLKALRDRMEAEERAELSRELKGLTLSYIASIQAVVRANWRRPAIMSDKWSCEVSVKQIPGGEIVRFRVTRCKGDKIFKHSVETALGKTSHLPPPPDPRVFDRNIVFRFREK